MADRAPFVLTWLNHPFGGWEKTSGVAPPSLAKGGMALVERNVVSRSWRNRGSAGYDDAWRCSPVEGLASF